VVVLRARLAQLDEELEHRALGDARSADDGADRHALDEEPNDLSAAGGVEDVHTDHHA
jgi:hypothetical protein